MKKIEFKNLPDKTTPINSTNLNKIQDNIEEVFEGNEAMGSIVVEDISCKNLFDKNDVITGYRLGSDGALLADSNYFCSGFITVKPNIQYTANWAMETRECVCYYDESYNFIERNERIKTFTTPSNCHHVRMTGLTSDINNRQLEKGSTATEYTPFKKFGYNAQESMGNIVVDGIVCKNIYDSYSYPLMVNNAINGDNGTIYSSSVNWYTTVEYIPVNKYAGKNIISSSDSTTICFYDSNKVFISSIKKQGIIPTNAYYMRFDTHKDYVNELYIELGTTLTDYTSHKKFGYNSTDSMGEIVVDDISCKNLLDFNSITKYNRDLSSSPTVGSALSFYNETKALQFYIPATNLRGKTLTYSNSSKYSNYIRIFELDSNYKYIKTVSRVGFTVGATTSYLCVILKEATAISTTATDIEPQLEKGSVATNYVEHKKFSNKEIKSVSLWSGRVYESGSILTLRKPLEIGNIYIIEFYGLSGLYKSYETFIYTGNKYVQLNYYSSPDSTGFRYRLECEGNTITISNESVGNVNNSAITNIYEITSS